MQKVQCSWVAFSSSLGLGATFPCIHICSGRMQLYALGHSRKDVLFAKWPVSPWAAVAPHSGLCYTSWVLFMRGLGLEEFESPPLVGPRRSALCTACLSMRRYLEGVRPSMHIRCIPLLASPVGHAWDMPLLEEKWQNRPWLVRPVRFWTSLSSLSE